jgi:hypothetical protein
MNDDLIARLRESSNATYGRIPWCDEAADALEAQAKRIVELEAALRPMIEGTYWITSEHVQAARAALAPKESSE